MATLRSGVSVSCVITGLYTYPVKSMREISHTSIDVTPSGLRDDRRFMVVEARDGGFVTQRRDGVLAQMRSMVDGDQLWIEHGGDVCEVELGATGPERTVTVWRYTGAAIDRGDSVAAWLSQRLGRDVRLVETPASFDRTCNEAYVPAGTPVGFADGYPFLVIAEEALADLNARLDASIDMRRFRPNIVIAGGPVYVEDEVAALTFGDVTLKMAKPCVRCTITTLDPETGKRMGQEPLRTLATYRNDKTLGGPVFGGNFVVQVQGEPSEGVRAI